MWIVGDNFRNRKWEIGLEINFKTWIKLGDLKSREDPILSKMNSVSYPIGGYIYGMKKLLWKKWSFIKENLHLRILWQKFILW